MPKLTKNQVVACNIIDSMLRWMSESSEDPNAQEALILFVAQHGEYRQTKDRECLTVAKDYIDQLYEIFRKAKEDWELIDLEDCKYE